MRQIGGGVVGSIRRRRREEVGRLCRGVEQRRYDRTPSGAGGCRRTSPPALRREGRGAATRRPASERSPLQECPGCAARPFPRAPRTRGSLRRRRWRGARPSSAGAVKRARTGDRGGARRLPPSSWSRPDYHLSLHVSRGARRGLPFVPRTLAFVALRWPGARAWIVLRARARRFLGARRSASGGLLPRSHGAGGGSRGPRRRAPSGLARASHRLHAGHRSVASPDLTETLAPSRRSSSTTALQMEGRSSSSNDGASFSPGGLPLRGNTCGGWIAPTGRPRGSVPARTGMERSDWGFVVRARPPSYERWQRDARSRELRHLLRHPEQLSELRSSPRRRAPVPPMAVPLAPVTAESGHDRCRRQLRLDLPVRAGVPRPSTLELSAAADIDQSVPGARNRQPGSCSRSRSVITRG